MSIYMYNYSILYIIKKILYTTVYNYILLNIIKVIKEIKYND